MRSRKETPKTQPTPLSAPLLEVEVKDLARGGAGVARDDSGRVIFVPFTAPGDRVRVRVTLEKKHYAQGELVEVLEPSPLRVKPPCPIFGRCGGCEWQHLPYELQWKTKAGGVRHALTRVGVELPAGEGRWQEFPAEQVWGYRNRIQLRGTGTRMGFYAAGSHDLIPVDRCEIARREINALWEETRQEGARLPLPYKVELAVLPSGEVKKAWNSRHGAAGFRQIHDDQNEKLKAWVAENITPGRPLLDLFGGAGNLCLALASRVPEIHCVDLGAPAARPQGVPENVHFHRSAVATWLIRAGRDLKPGRWSAISDPPREGLGNDFNEIVRAFAKLGVTELVTVGCDPDKWASDLSKFLKHGWRLERAAVLDFFPQTPHVESVAFLKFDQNNLGV